MLLSFNSFGRLRKVVLAVSVAAYALLWVGGVGQHLFRGLSRKENDWVASLFLLLAGLIVFVGTRAINELPSLLWIAAFGFVIEVIGVRTGLPFGAYSYSRVLQPQVFGVPVVMAFAWMVLIVSIKQTLQAADFPRWIELLLAAIWVTAIDLIIDPLAANVLGYWHWRTAGNYYGIPTGNFAGWFVTSLAIFAIIKPRWRPNPWSMWIGFSIVLFFTLIAFSQRLFLVAMIGAILAVIQILFSRMYGGRDWPTPHKRQ